MRCMVKLGELQTRISNRYNNPFQSGGHKKLNIEDFLLPFKKIIPLSKRIIIVFSNGFTLSTMCTLHLQAKFNKNTFFLY